MKLSRLGSGLGSGRPFPTVSEFGMLSGRQDLNLRPPEPHSGALPGCATPRRAAYSMPPPYPPPQAGEGKSSSALTRRGGGKLPYVSSPRFLKTMLIGVPSKPKACRSCVSRNRRYEK